MFSYLNRPPSFCWFSSDSPFLLSHSSVLTKNFDQVACPPPPPPRYPSIFLVFFLPPLTSVFPPSLFTTKSFQGEVTRGHYDEPQLAMQLIIEEGTGLQHLP